jgi:glycosyltransferase involved in cell wall biosynthesis
VKVALFSNTSWYLYNFRLPLARALRERGFEVVMISPPDAYGPRLQHEGFRWLPFSVSRSGTNPFAELITLGRLFALFRRERPDLVHSFTIKCVIYAGLALTGSKTATVSSVTGMGHVFTSRSLKSRLLRPVITLLYRRALRRSQVIFQNPDDLAAFERLSVTRAGQFHLIRGSGIDVSKFRPTGSSNNGVLTVLVVARLIREKGIVEFCEAARILRARGTSAQFKVAGDVDPGNPSSLNPDQISALSTNCGVEFLGHVSDIRALWQRADIACLPSYREGLPRSLLEASASGLPLVTTDVPGCRELVKNEINGLIVPPANARELAKALERLLGDDVLRKTLGGNARRIVEEQYSEQRVIAATLQVYGVQLPAAHNRLSESRERIAI